MEYSFAKVFFMIKKTNQILLKKLMANVILYFLLFSHVLEQKMFNHIFA